MNRLIPDIFNIIILYTDNETVDNALKINSCMYKTIDEIISCYSCKSKLKLKKLCDGKYSCNKCKHMQCESCYTYDYPYNLVEMNSCPDYDLCGKKCCTRYEHTMGNCTTLVCDICNLSTKLSRYIFRLSNKKMCFSCCGLADFYGCTQISENNKIIGYLFDKNKEKMNFTKEILSVMPYGIWYGYFMEHQRRENSYIGLDFVSYDY